jgi:retinol dehydrogenase 12
MKTILVTGVTGSIGQSVAEQLAANATDKIVLIGRNVAKLQTLKNTLHGNATIETLPMDLADPGSIDAGVKLIKEKYPKIDALINIAAVYKQRRETTGKGFEAMFATNHLGPFRLTLGLMDVLKQTPHALVLTVSAPSSTKLNFDDLNGEKKFSALNAFGASKMANLLFSFKLAREFQSGTQSAIAYHPGLVKSELLHEASPLLSGLLRLMSSRPQSAAKTICDLIESHDHSLNGKFFTKGKKELKATAYAYEELNQEMLWKKSLALLN